MLDRTGLAGAYDIDLTFASEAAVVAGAAPNSLASLPTALRDQLGLRLDSARAPVEVLVIDRVEPSTDN